MNALEEMFFQGFYVEFISMLESGAYAHKNIKDRSKIARRFAKELMRKPVYAFWTSCVKRDPDADYLELMCMADSWDLWRIAAKEHRMLSRFSRGKSRRKARGI